MPSTRRPAAGRAGAALLATHLAGFRLSHLPMRHHRVHMIHPASCARRLLEFIAARDGRVLDET